MADVKLSNGKEITFDLSKMTYAQYKGIFDAKEADKTSDTTLARVAGITVAELNALLFDDYRRLFAAFLKKIREPLNDPND